MNAFEAFVQDESGTHSEYRVTASRAGLVADRALTRFMRDTARRNMVVGERVTITVRRLAGAVVNTAPRASGQAVPK